MSEKQRKLVLVGARGVGKSSLATVFSDSRFDEQYVPTIENCYQRKIKVKGLEFQTQIVDTAGQDQFSIFQTQYAVGIEGYVLVYSITNRSSFDLIPTLNDKILNITGNDTVPRIIVANKNDLDDQRKVSQEDGMKLAKELKCIFVETSAKSNTNVESIFSKLIEEIEGGIDVKSSSGCLLS
eukprot:gene10515-3037_t